MLPVEGKSRQITATRPCLARTIKNIRHVVHVRSHLGSTHFVKVEAVIDPSLVVLERGYIPARREYSVGNRAIALHTRASTVIEIFHFLAEYLLCAFVALLKQIVRNLMRVKSACYTLLYGKARSTSVRVYIGAIRMRKYSHERSKGSRLREGRCTSGCIGQALVICLLKVRIYRSDSFALPLLAIQRGRRGTSNRRATWGLME